MGARRGHSPTNQRQRVSLEGSTRQWSWVLDLRDHRVNKSRRKEPRAPGSVSRADRIDWGVGSVWGLCRVRGLSEGCHTSCSLQGRTQIDPELPGISTSLYK